MSWWSPAGLSPSSFLHAQAFFMTHCGFMCPLLSPGQISPSFPNQRNTYSRSPSMLSPQTHVLLSHYTNHTMSLCFLRTIETCSSACPSLPGGDLGQTDRSGISNTVPLTRLWYGGEGSFISQELLCEPLLFSCSESWHLGMKTLKEQSFSLKLLRM